MTQNTQQNKALKPLENFVISGVAACISKTAAAPIERVKIMLQNQGEMVKLGTIDKQYNGITDCFVKVYQNEGVLHFWRGNTPNCLRYLILQALNFMIKEKVKQTFQFSKQDPYWEQFKKNVLSGSVAGSLTQFFVYHLDYVRTRLAADAKNKGNRMYNGMLDVYKKTLKSDGIVGLHRGFIISSLSFAVYRGAYFGLYDSFKPILIGDKSDFIKDFALGYSITVFAGMTCYPFDTIRRRMMMTSGMQVKYNGSLDCALKIYRNEGMRALYHGAGANILRAIAGAGALSGFDKLREIYSNFGH